MLAAPHPLLSLPAPSAGNTLSCFTSLCSTLPHHSHHCNNSHHHPKSGVLLQLLLLLLLLLMLLLLLLLLLLPLWLRPHPPASAAEGRV